MKDAQELFHGTSASFDCGAPRDWRSQSSLFAGLPFGITVCCGLSPGGFAEVEGAFFDRAATVQVGGLPAAVLGYQEFFSGDGGERGLQIQLPVELAPGATTLVITSGGVRSDPFPIMLDTYSPAFLRTGIFAAIFIDRGLPSGGFAPSSCWADQRLKAGDLVRVYTTGLGSTDRLVATGVMAPVAPRARTLMKPSIAIEGKAAEVIGVFTVDGSGYGQGAILNADASLNSAANPAERGSIIVLYLSPSADGSMIGGTFPRPQLRFSLVLNPATGDGTRRGRVCGPVWACRSFAG